MLFSIGIYLLEAVFCYFVIRALGGKGWKGFIPIYNIITIFTEYRGRVYSRHWGIYYLCYFIFSFLFNIFLSARALDISYILRGEQEQLPFNLTFFIIISFTGHVISFIFKLLLIYPLLYTKKLKYLVLPMLVLGSVIYFSTAMYIWIKNPNSLSDMVGYAAEYQVITNLAEIFLGVVSIFVALMFYKQVKDNGQKIISKIDNPEYHKEDIHKNKFNLLEC